MRISSVKISWSEKLSIFSQNCLLFFKLAATSVIHEYLACDKPNLLKEDLDAKKTDASLLSCKFPVEAQFSKEMRNKIFADNFFAARLEIC